MGIQYGYKRSFNYIAGITAGFMLVMLLCAMLSRTLLAVLPTAEVYLRWVGAGYILWLAFSILRSGSVSSESDQPAQAFVKGFFLQLLNPKAVVFGLTIYSTFLAAIAGRLDLLAVSVLLLAINTFAAISTWTLFGAAIRRWLANDLFRRGVNAILAAMLAYTAASLAGVV